MKAPHNRFRIWRPHHVQSIELVRGISQGYSTPRHFHEELELGIKQGEGWEFYYRGTKHSVPANTLVLTQPGEAHSANSQSSQDRSFRGLRVDAGLLECIATEVAGCDRKLPFFPTPLVTDFNLNQQVLQMHQALEQAMSQLEQQSLLLDFVAQLILRCAESPPSLSSVGGEPIERVRDYLEDYYDQEISLEQLSQLVNLSPFHLNRVFRRTFGLPPHAYQIQVRVVRAKRLLRSGLSIEQVAARTGFASQSHFGSHFKRLVRVTPRQYVQDSKNVINPDS